MLIWRHTHPRYAATTETRTNLPLIPVVLSCHWGARGADITCTMISWVWHLLGFKARVFKSRQVKVKDKTPQKMKWKVTGFFMTINQHPVTFVSENLTPPKHISPGFKLLQLGRHQLLKHSKVKLVICRWIFESLRKEVIAMGYRLRAAPIIDRSHIQT